MMRIDRAAVVGFPLRASCAMASGGDSTRGRCGSTLARSSNKPFRSVPPLLHHRCRFRRMRPTAWSSTPNPCRIYCRWLIECAASLPTPPPCRHHRYLLHCSHHQRLHRLLCQHCDSPVGWPPPTRRTVSLRSSTLRVARSEWHTRSAHPQPLHLHLHPQCRHLRNRPPM